MKVVGYCALHYGLPYLEWSIRSVIDHVDEFYVLYSPHGSHNGNRGTLPPIDSEADLQATARRGAGDKLRWITGEWSHEGQQRDSIHQYAPDADVILVVDYDECWQPGLAEIAIKAASTNKCSRFRLPIIHYYKSFHRAVLNDPAFPVRVLAPKAPDRELAIPTSLVLNHFGYAIPLEYMRYKWHGIHGHQAELKPGWIENVYANPLRWRDVHPVGTHWYPERVDPMEFLPRYMMDHPFYFKDLIE